jgi:hypothetical protein
MAKGKSNINFCAAIGISKETFYTWVKEKKDFSDSYKKGRALCETFWENIGMRGILGLPIVDETGKEGHVNPAMFCFYMKNRFGWSDKQEQHITATVTTVSDETRDKLKKIFNNTGDNGN